MWRHTGDEFSGSEIVPRYTAKLSSFDPISLPRWETWFIGSMLGLFSGGCPLCPPMTIVESVPCATPGR